MKAKTTINNSLPMYPFGKNEVIADHGKHNDFQHCQEFTVPTPMTQQEIAPPLYVWDRIASILDEQDRKKMLIKKTEEIAFGKNHANRNLVMALLAVVVVTGAAWYFA